MVRLFWTSIASAATGNAEPQGNLSGGPLKGYTPPIGPVREDAARTRTRHGGGPVLASAAQPGRSSRQAAPWCGRSRYSATATRKILDAEEPGGLRNGSTAMPFLRRYLPEEQERLLRGERLPMPALQ